ncbi:phage Gp37/Gp68 family protein [Herbaspirillum chlorophenolicum]|uniref:phage Gp37/Gp68 family protein n=1 Tax=Herbaspirillum chlorophenolicum TaxID=211589 RepID=UPI00067BA9CD|nr:phage Gp37/Gp68 family protein [Herbaspirillum chlorophenolicum]
MSENTKIEWADHTFNPWEGCQKVGPGCDHCYAESRNARFAGGAAVNWGPGAPRRRTSAANWNKPLAWNAAATEFQVTHGRRQRVFCASLADVFDNAVDPQWRDDLFSLIEATPHLDWLLLTKRIGNVGNMLPVPFSFAALYPNVWIGITVVNQTEADRDIPKLLQIDAAKRFLSMEPLLGPVDLNQALPPVHCESCDADYGALSAHGAGKPIGIDWVIVGGESGPDARPTHSDWARYLRDQCNSAGVPFLFKQWGEWIDVSVAGFGSLRGEIAFIRSDGTRWEHAPRDEDADCITIRKVGKKAAGRLLDGRTWDEVPA